MRRHGRLGRTSSTRFMMVCLELLRLMRAVACQTRCSRTVRNGSKSSNWCTKPAQ